MALYCSLRPNSTVAFRNFEEEARQSAVWDSEQNATSSSRDNLASLYRPPFSLMFNGPFDTVSRKLDIINISLSLASAMNMPLFWSLFMWQVVPSTTKIKLHNV